MRCLQEDLNSNAQHNKCIVVTYATSVNCSSLLVEDNFITLNIIPIMNFTDDIIHVLMLN